VKLLLVGGSGHLGSLICPHLAPNFELRILDPRPPADASLDYHAGCAGDLPTLQRALQGCQALVYLPLAQKPDGGPDVQGLDANFDLQVKYLYQALQQARRMHIARAVFASSMSVHRHPPQLEEVAGDAHDTYGLVKQLGEQVCQHATRGSSLTVVALRLYRPVALGDFFDPEQSRRFPHQVAAPDVARAFARSILEPLQGFHVFNIASTLQVCQRAQEVLNWHPHYVGSPV